jgi:hypothetical protein
MKAQTRHARVRHLLWVFALLTGLAVAQTPDRFVPSGISQDEAQAFLTRLQTAARAHDAQAIAGMTHYPLTVNGRPGPRDAARFTQAFNTIFTDKVRDAVLNAHLADLFASYRGVMIGGGQVWISAICADAKAANPCTGERTVAIIAINNRSLTAEQPR